MFSRPIPLPSAHPQCALILFGDFGLYKSLTYLFTYLHLNYTVKQDNVDDLLKIELSGRTKYQTDNQLSTTRHVSTVTHTNIH